MLGCGNVGAALVAADRRPARRHRGPHRRCASRSPGSRCAASPRSARSTLPDGRAHHTTPPAVVDDPDIDVVVEVIGGIEPARELILDALEGRQAGGHRQQGAAGQPRRRAVRRGRRRPASTCCSRPRSPAASRSSARCASRSPASDIDRVMGIVNGTTNYILTRMTEDGRRYAEALAEAQSLGYAERDPTADVEGYDAGAKAAIIASHRLRRPGRGRRRLPRGHRRHHRRRHRLRRSASATSSSCWPSPSSVDGADGAEIGGAGPPGDGARRRTRWPPCATASTPCSSRATAVGDLMFYGRGAGGVPTASAVLGDLIDAAVNLRKGTHATHRHAGQGPHPPDRRARVRVLPQPRGGRPARRARRGRRRVRRATACRSARWSRRAWATRPASSSSPTSPARPTCRPRCTTSATSTSSTASASVLRVIGELTA